MTNLDEASDWVKLFQNIITGVVGLWGFLNFCLVWVFGAFCVPWNRAKDDSLKGFYVSRQDLNPDIKAALETDDFRTVLVYGAKGSGKSTLITKHLQLKWAVIQVNYLPTDNLDTIADKIAKSCGITYIRMSPVSYITVMRILSWSLFCTPTIIFNVNENATKSTVDSALGAAKTLSYDQKSIYAPRIIVDMSLSRPAISANVSIEGNRIVPVKVGEFTRQQASSFLDHYLPNKLDEIKVQGRKNNNNNEETLKDVSREIILGYEDLNPEFLKNICVDLAKNLCPDEEAARKIIQKTISKKKSGFSLAWKTFSKLLSVELKKNLSADEVSGRLTTMVEEFVTKKCVSFLKICTFLDKEGSIVSSVTFEEFALWNSISGSPHLFDVDPFSVDIGVNGPLALNTLEEVLKKDS